MKTWHYFFFFGWISAIAFAQEVGKKQKLSNAIFYSSNDNVAREGLVIEPTNDGGFQTDSGTKFRSLDELGVFLRQNRDTFAPRLIISSKSPDVKYYNLAMACLLLFEEHCGSSSFVVENEE